MARISSASSSSRGRQGQPPQEPAAEGLDGDAVAAEHGLAEGGGGGGEVLQAVEAAALRRRPGGRVGAWRISWEGGGTGPEHNVIGNYPYTTDFRQGLNGRIFCRGPARRPQVVP